MGLHRGGPRPGGTVFLNLLRGGSASYLTRHCTSSPKIERRDNKLRNVRSFSKLASGAVAKDGQLEEAIRPRGV